MVEVAYYGFIALTVGAAAYIALTRNLVRAAFALLAAFIGLAGLYVFVGADVPAVAQVIVYVGGVLVLLLFGVMLTHRPLPSALAQVPQMPRTGLRTQLAGLLVAGGVVVAVLSTFTPERLGRSASASGPTGEALRQIGVMSLTDYLLAFELLSVLLLVALVGAATLARPNREEAP